MARALLPGELAPPGRYVDTAADDGGMIVLIANHMNKTSRCRLCGSLVARAFTIILSA